MGLRVKTKSIWGFPNPSYFKFLDEIIKRGLPKTLCILGCSDGKFVIHAAKKGFQILAIDIDRIALYGGKTIIGNQQTQLMGLEQRLKIEQVEENLELIHGNFLSYKPTKTFSGVFTSGSIHYPENAKYSLGSILDSIKTYVSKDGLLFIEYIHKSEADNDPNRHFVTKEQIAKYFNDVEWAILKHSRRTYIESPNPRISQIHKIVWGYFHAIKNAGFV